MKLLLALDGSDSAAAAVDFLLCLPFVPGGEITVLSVIDDYLFPEQRDGLLTEQERLVIEDTREAVREEGEALLAAQSARLTAAGWSCATEVRTGNPADVIVAAAEARAVDLVVMGSHGLSGVKRFLLGSVSARVLEYAHCSVLIVRPPLGDLGAAADCRRLLVAYDGSPSARNAVEFSASMALKPASEVQLLGVMPLVTCYRQDIRQRLSTIWQDEKAATQAALDELAASSPWPGATVTTELREGPSVSKEILEAAIAHDSDLIVLGHKGRNALQRLLLGSTTSQVAHHAPCSVLAVRG